MRRPACRRTFKRSLVIVLTILIVSACRTSSSSPVQFSTDGGTSPPVATSTVSSAADSPAVAQSQSPTPTSTRLGPGQPISAQSRPARTGAAQTAVPKAHPCVNVDSPTRVYSEPPFTWDAGGEGIPASAHATQGALYCGPTRWNVLPRALQDPYGLPTFTPSVSEHIGLPVSELTPGKQIKVGFAEDTQGNTPYIFEIAAEFNSNAQNPIDVRIMTALSNVPAPTGQQVPATTVAGRPYKVYADAKLKVYTFVPGSNQASGSLDIAPYLRDAIARGWVPESASLDHVAFVLEVFKAFGSQIFYVNGFSVSMNLTRTAVVP